MRKCEETGEIVFVEEAAGTARAQNSAGETRMKRKVGYSSTTLVQRRSRRRVISETENMKSEEASGSNDPCVSCCSSHRSAVLDKQTSELSDLEEEVSGDIPTSTYGSESCSERRETTPLNDFVADESLGLDFTPKLPRDLNSTHRCFTDAKMPSKEELEEFFSAAEKDLLGKFSDKYNFDFEKEEPLEGRYQWVRQNPSTPNSP